jgi:hypothetical protein
MIMRPLRGGNGFWEVKDFAKSGAMIVIGIVLQKKWRDLEYGIRNA